MEGVNGTIVILCLIGVALAIFLSYKFNLQMGVSAMVFAFIIGVLFMGLRVKNVIAMFPTSVFFQVMSLSLFFGVGVVNGRMKAVGPGTTTVVIQNVEATCRWDIVVHVYTEQEMKRLEKQREREEKKANRRRLFR